ncbi:MAG: VUT family protein [Alicyclobacillus sp.]|nr:VUT family protein [Alicyclobacillus sp.]
MLLTGIYLAAIVLANLSVTWFGPASAIANAFLFVGLDFTARDGLHLRWNGRRLTAKMALLIGSGALLSVLLNHHAMRVAIASCISFALSETADAVSFQLLKRRARMLRLNGANAVGAIVDSVVFPTIAFGAFMPWVTFGQFAAKLVGGALWALVLSRLIWPRAAERSTPGV